ncbi:MAG: hypothetical protein ACK5HJ_08420 [Bacteroidota bacterium]|jgi:predicted AAA+ superfamily ATPase
MDSLMDAHQRQMSQLDIRFRRTLNIDWNDRLSGVTGAWGVGKTTYLFTYIKEQLKNTPNGFLY